MEFFREYYRPSYHFRPKDNWMNDPNGPIYYREEYHIFYQYNPNGAQWGTIHWGHAKSKDLIHYEECPIALYPDSEEGEVHCYSGCAFEINDEPVIYYTSVGEGIRNPMEGAMQRMANCEMQHTLQNSSDKNKNLMVWEKRQELAVRKEVHEFSGVHIAMWRDPFVWKEDDGWYMLLGGTKLSSYAENMDEVKRGKGCLALYTSKDTKSWQFKNIILETEDTYLLECPCMLCYGEEYILLYSPLDAVRYQVGRLNKENWEFIVKEEGIFDYSILKRGFYAPNTFWNEPLGRKIVMGWLSETDRERLGMVWSWSGMLSIPREVSLQDGKLRIRPAQEVELLRKKKKLSFDAKNNVLKDIYCRGHNLEIDMEFERNEENEKTGEFELYILSSDDNREKTVLSYSMNEEKLRLDRECSNKESRDASSCKMIEMPVKVLNKLKVRVFIDGSAVEIYVNERSTMSARIYPSHEQSDRVCLVKCNDIALIRFDVWDLAL